MVKKILRQSKNILNRQNNTILSAAAIIALSYLVSALLGLVRNRLLVSRFFSGLEADLDVYFAAFIVPDTLFQLLIMGALSASFIPVYQEYIQKKSLIRANKMANSTLTSLAFIQIIITVLLIIFAKPIAGLITHYPEPQLNLMVNLIRIMSLAQLLFTVSAFLTSILQAHRRFLVPALAPIFYNLGTIAGIFFLSSKFGIYSAAIGIVFGALLHLLVQLPWARALGFSPKIVFQPQNPGTKLIFRLMPPRTAALSLSQIERWVAVNLTSLLSAGSLAIFSFARQLYVLPITLFGVSLAQASFPILSANASSKNKPQFVSILSQSTLQIFFFALPASVLILVLRIPLVRLVFGASSFPWQATLLTAKALALLALSIAPQAANHLLTRAFHAKKNTRTPLTISLITITFFCLTAYVSTRQLNLGVLGITSSLSLSNFLNFLILLVLINKKIGPLNITVPIIKMTFVSFLTAISLWFPMRLLDQFVFDTTRTFSLVLLTIIVSLIGFAVYLFFSWILKVDQLKSVLSLTKKIGNWRRLLIQTDEVIETSVADQV
ncbi:murein biosynthesis integral membrane protein MurJ [Patescibacteria group bacterium]|nr:murein biosynthesis integral membrane protein MurJ [Patescibacteria group bacterium]